MKWNVSLSDMVSGPSRAISSALAAVQANFKSLGTEANRAQAAMAKSMTVDANGRMHDAITGKFASLPGAGAGKADQFSSLGAAADLAAGPIQGLIGSIAGVTAALGAMGAAATVAFAKSAISAAVFRQNALVGLEVMLQSKEKANQVYEKAVKMAAVTPFESTDIIPLFQKLLASGFNENELEKVATSLGDMAASRGMNKEIMDRLALAFGKLKSKGKLNQEILNIVTEVGLSEKDVIDRIAKDLGKSAKEVQQLLSKGKIDSDVATKALLGVIDAKYGGTMAKMAKTLQGLWSTFVSRPFDLFNKALGDDKGGLSEWIETISKGLDSMGNGFDPEKGSGKQIMAFVNLIGSAFNSLTKVLIAFGEGLSKGLNAKMPDADKFGKIDLTMAIQTFTLLGETIGQVIGYMAQLAAWATRNETSIATLGKAANVAGYLIAGTFIAAVAAAGLFMAGVIAIPATFLIVLTAAQLLGEKLYNVFKGISLESLMTSLSSIGTALANAATAAFSQAMNIGAQIVAGIMSALSGLGGSIQSSVNGAVGGVNVNVKPGSVSTSGVVATAGAGGAGTGGMTHEASPYSVQSSANVSQFVPSPSSASPSSEAGAGSKGLSVTLKDCVFGSNSEATIKEQLVEAFSEIALNLGVA